MLTTMKNMIPVALLALAACAAPSGETEDSTSSAVRRDGNGEKGNGKGDKGGDHDKGNKGNDHDKGNKGNDYDKYKPERSKVCDKDRNWDKDWDEHWGRDGGRDHDRDHDRDCEDNDRPPPPCKYNCDDDNGSKTW